jgi:hypothetical protein
MYKPLLFFLAVLLLTAIAYRPMEGFQNLMGINVTTSNLGTPPEMYTRSDIQKKLPVAEQGIGNIDPSPAPPSDLPSAPAGLQSKETPNPYRNPTLEPAKYIRLVAVKEDLQAFFGFQAESLRNKSDPSIQIPLTRARADLSELIDVQSVIERNPGLQSRINNKQLDDMKSNLNYLRETLNKISIDGSEGFQNYGRSISKYEEPASLKELQAFQIKVVVEIQRLGVSGTSDPLTVSRINTLTKIKNDIDDVIEKIQTGVYSRESVPVLKSDIDKSLPVLGDQNKPLPRALKNLNLPPAISSLFPGGMSPKDSEQAIQINNVLKGYMKNLFENSSWGFNFQYNSPIKHHICVNSNPNCTLKKQCSICSKIPKGLPGVLKNNCNVKGYTKSSSNGKVIRYKTNNMCTKGLPGSSEFRIFPEPKGSGMDWKKRSTEIIEQIKKRKMNPLQFGALHNNAKVSKEFSWKGYTRMLCTRLNSTADPGFAVTVGCPPEEWKGWKE